MDERVLPKLRRSLPSVGEPDTQRRAELDPDDRAPRGPQRMKAQRMNEAESGERSERADRGGRHGARPQRENPAAVYRGEPCRRRARGTQFEPTDKFHNDPASTPLANDQSETAGADSGLGERAATR